MKAGLIIVTGIYWSTIILYSVIILGTCGTGGIHTMIQAHMFGWKSMYNISVWKEYVIIICGGYIGCLFFALLTMLVSAKAKSSIIAVTIPFIIIIVPSLLMGTNMEFLNKILGLLPDQLLQMEGAISQFILYCIGNKVFPSIPVLFTSYLIFCFILCPLIYNIYRKTVIK